MRFYAAFTSFPHGNRYIFGQHKAVLPFSPFPAGGVIASFTGRSRYYPFRCLPGTFLRWALVDYGACSRCCPRRRSRETALMQGCEPRYPSGSVIQFSRCGRGTVNIPLFINWTPSCENPWGFLKISLYLLTGYPRAKIREDFWKCPSIY